MNLKCKLGLIVCVGTFLSIPILTESVSAEKASFAHAVMYLTQGSRGEQVKELQARLKYLGYFKANVTSYYGQITANSVKWFQSQFGLVKVNGIVDDPTWQMLLRATKNFNLANIGQSIKKPENKKNEREKKSEQLLESSIPQSTCGYSENEITLLEKMCYAEARGEGHSGMVAVCAVLLNRTKTVGFPDSVAGCIYEQSGGHYAFESVKNGEIYRAKPNQDTRKAVMTAINGTDPTNGCTYFFNPSNVRPGSWVWSNVKIEKKMGKHSFGRKK